MDCSILEGLGHGISWCVMPVGDNSKSGSNGHVVNINEMRENKPAIACRNF